VAQRQLDLLEGGAAFVRQLRESPATMPHAA
jgi:hypothetical protein